MRKRTIETTEFTMEEHEARIVLTCLDYCAHRLSTEESTGLHKAKVRQGQVDKMREQLREALT